MEETKEAKRTNKVYIGDWAETSESGEAYARVTEDLRTAKGALLKFFAAAFLTSCPPPTDGERNEGARGRCLDIGCGPGGFTVNHLLPCLPVWCKKVVAVDNSDSMLQLAREKQPHPNVEYKHMDIAVDEDVARFYANEGCFDMVCSFAALHWISDHHQAIRNIEKLVAPGGECFITFAGSMLLFDFFAALMASPRWTKYSEHDVKQHSALGAKLTWIAFREQ
ncbi:hypothetical protein HPB48_023554 [Haemaphysalis longicornis]|uniref:Methyltransferase type 11 domain-containing protein n=1 Tax=Haemaphysalis longicornis TaxID=44386 RepID=A0A9J6H735_HAELO|nr:hypothetical protein HPB48_023554 [Haemaphysalis longicornis]